MGLKAEGRSRQIQYSPFKVVLWVSYMKDFPDFSGNLNQLLQINNQITNSGTALQLGVEPV